MGLVEAMHSTIDHLRGWQRALEHRLARFVAWRLVVRTAGELRADDATHMAAGVAYYAVLSLFPLLLALIAGLSLALRSDTVEAELFDFFETYLPGSVELLEKNITAAAPVRGAIGLLGLLGLLWSASAIFGAISRAVNRAWDVHRDRPFYVAKLRHLAMAAGVGILFILSLMITTALQTLGGVTLPGVGSLSFLGNTVVSIGGRVLPFLLSFAIFTLIYKFIPNTKTFWRYVWPGALLAAVLFELAKSVFILYLDRFANYQAVYGSIGSVIALLVWMYLSAFVLILGAEVSTEYGRMREGVDPGTLIDPNLLD